MAFYFADPRAKATRVRKARRGGRGRPPEDKLDILGDQMSRVVTMDLSGGLKKWGSKVNYDTVADAVYSGDWRDVYKSLPIKGLKAEVRGALKGVGKMVSKTSEVAAAQVKEVVPAVDPKLLSLGTDNPQVDRYLDVRTGALMEGVTEDMQVNVQGVVRRGLDRRESPRQIADNMQADGTLVLDSRRQLALENFKAGLADLSPKRAEKLIEAKRAELLDQRAFVIARTEVSFAQNQAQLNVWQTARAKGLLPKTATKVWVTGGGDTCKYCLDLQGSEVALDEVWNSSNGDVVMAPPLHPNCRCQMAIKTEADATEEPDDDGLMADDDGEDD